ncbi:hypothetical protein QVD17_18950 [Tagetes erecta]|uniref:DUF4219 domain-containing protein n=1 Tax=Tagetes erecta TaxID=13708 RepID=A0AAD8KIM8_TARER|nr:hypothetical protein QVD17_18950 [Tagetes erecta]
MSRATFVEIILAIILPPLGVFFKFGCKRYESLRGSINERNVGGRTTDDDELRLQDPYMPKYPRFKPMSTLATTSNTPKETSSVSLQIPVLTATNYTTWSIKMEAVMDAQGLWESIETPDGEVVDQKTSKTARAFLFQAIPEEVLLQVSKKKTAKEVWDSLKVRYLGVDRVQKHDW